MSGPHVLPRRFPRGLVVGKFCPLHLGHEHLIQHAQQHCDELVVLSYTEPGFPGLDRERRAAWLAARFPALRCHVLDPEHLSRLCHDHGVAPRQIPADDAPGDVHRHFVAGLMLDLFGGPVQAVFTSEAYGDGFAAVLSQVFGAPVRHVCVDLHRVQVPVSGTQVRRDPLAHRHLLSPEVFADFMPRIALLGGESTGKTTLARALAQSLNTAWVPEFGRTLWEQQAGRLSFEDMALIGSTQIAHEVQQAQLAQGCLICDTTPLTTRLYSEWMFGRVDPVLSAAAERRYTLTVLCDTDIPFEQDGTRQAADFRLMQQARYRQELSDRNVPFLEVSGSLDQRVSMAVRAIQAAVKREDGAHPVKSAP